MQRLSGLDASFLYLETPRMHMHVAIAAVLDPSAMPGGYSFDKIQELIASRVHLLPPFRRRLVRVPFDLHHPLWVDDPDFDIIHHVRRVAVPAPGGPRELGAIAGRINSTPLDRSRPLWEVWVIEGLEKGRFAILTKVHHCAIDGASGAELLVHLFSLDRVAPPLPPAAPPPTPESIPTDLDLVRHALLSRVRQPVQMMRLASRTVQAVRDVVRMRRDPETGPGGTPLTAPRTHFNAAVTAQRSVAFARLPLKDIKAVKNAAGTTVNDVVLAVCAGALRRYLQGRRELPAQPLIAVCPISVRNGSSQNHSSNKVSAMFTSLATDIDDPLQRLLAIRRVTRNAKEEHSAIGADMLQNWAEFAAPTTFNLAARFYTRMKLADRHRPIHNVVISNVPGPPFPLYLAGAELVAAYPMGPVMEGAGLNITVMSYLGSVDFGFMAGSTLMPDLWDLADEVEPAFDELLRSVQAHDSLPAHDTTE
jgi:WS/DGAT/MGAT family acyltransferase